MARVFATDIVEISSTIGTGAYALGGARAGYRSFAEGYDTGDTPYYVVRSTDDTKYEYNRFGNYTAGGPDTLSRNVVMSSNGGAPVSWTVDDHPLLVYVPSASEVLDDMIRGWLADARSAWLKFGHWFDSSPVGSIIWKIYDGSTDITIGTIDESTHKITYPFMPAGMGPLPYSASTLPTGFLWANGAAHSRTTYPKLHAKYAADGYPYGSGDGSTTFNVPNMCGRVPAGKTDMGGVTDSANLTGGATLGADLGAQTKSSITVSATGSTSGSLSVSVSVSGSTSGVSGSTGGPDAMVNVDVNNDGAQTPVATSGHTHGVGTGGGSFSGSGSGSTSGSLSVSTSGSTGSFSIVQPTRIFNYVVATGEF